MTLTAQQMHAARNAIHAGVNAAFAERKRKDDEALRLMKKAKMHIQIYHCFYGALLERLKLRIDWRHDTMYTDAVVIGGNPEFVLSLKWEHLLYIMLHEVTHCALQHPFRRQQRRPSIWRQATDHVVNLTLNADPELKKMFPTGPNEGLADSRFQGLAAEQVYSILANEQKEKQEDQGKGGLAGATGAWGDCCDAGASGEPIPLQDEGEDEEDDQSDDDAKSKGKPKHSDSAAKSGAKNKQSDPSDDADAEDDASGGSAADGIDDEEGDEFDEFDVDDADSDSDDAGSCRVEPGDAEKASATNRPDHAQVEQLSREWEEAVMTAQLTAGGDIEKAMARSLGKALESKKSFAEYIDDFAASCCAAEDSWNRPNRRFTEYLPSRGQPGIKSLVLAIDTSGSISDDDLALMEATANRVMDEYHLKKAFVVYCDSRLRGVDEFEQGDSISLANAKGGGGTAFHPPLRYALELEDAGEEVAGIMYLTDLEGSVRDPEDFAHFNILWISTYAYKGRLPEPPGGLGKVCSMRD